MTIVAVFMEILLLSLKKGEILHSDRSIERCDSL